MEGGRRSRRRNETTCRSGREIGYFSGVFSHQAKNTGPGFSAPALAGFDVCGSHSSRGPRRQKGFATIRSD